jgi:outer membrane receptor protein involved in Fe transport
VPSQADEKPSQNSGQETAATAEVIVTANKLSAQMVLDVPSSIQAISSESLRDDGSAGFEDISDKIPGLSIQDQGPGDRQYVIRGINSTGDSTAGVFYDEAVISGSNANNGGGLQADIRLYDLDHIEVLRGPQGTLYGASAMSGVIKFVTKKPDLNEFGGYLNAEVSETQHGGGNNRVNGEINLPVVDGKLALRVVGWSIDDSGYIDELHVGTVGLERGINNDIVKGDRVSLRYEPVDNLTIDATYTSQLETSGGSPFYTPPGVNSAAGRAGLGLPTLAGCDLCNTDVDLSPSYDKFEVYSLTATYRLPSGTITATTNQYNRFFYLEFDTAASLESFGIPFPTVELQPQQRDLTSTEIRYASNFDFPVNFVAGLYRQFETNDLIADSLKANDLGLPNGPFSSCNCDDALTYPNGNTVFGRDDDRRTREYAGFGEVTWKVTPKLSLVGGIRYFTETLNGVQEQTHPFGGFPPGPTLVPIYDVPQSFTKVTYKFNASYKFDDGLLLYVTAAEGFRGGGLNAQSEPFEPIPGSFQPDSLWNYEVGAKGRLFDGKLDYQVDVYDIIWTNIQVQETTSNGAFEYTGNAGDAVVKGAEFEFEVHPTEHFSASLAGSYQNAYLSEGATPAQFAANPTLGLTGETLPEVPRLNFSVGVKYTQPIGDNWTGVLAADVNYRDSENSFFASNLYNVPLKSYTLLNLRAGLVKGPWRVNFFDRNATNDRAQLSVIDNSGQSLALTTVRPRTVGVNVTRLF